MIAYGGIDPSGSPARPSGCAVLDCHGALLVYRLCYSDEEIVDIFKPYNLKAMAIDAPQSLPSGMNLCCLDDSPSCSCQASASRACERDMRRRGFSLYPVNKNSFAKSWIRRGLALYKRFQQRRIPAYEVYPAAAKKVLFPCLKVKSKSARQARASLQIELSTLIDGLPPVEEQVLSDHLLDAVLAVLTLFLWFEKKQGEWIGDPQEGTILLPKSQKRFIHP